jgi:hypothetical protein
MNLVGELHRHRSKRYSQNGEDGVIARLFGIAGVTNRFFVEVGTGPGDECNTRLLRERGWSGIMIDSAFETPSLPLYREFVTAENINGLFAKYGVPESFDLLSIDIDGNDYWVWKALAPRYRARVVVIEFNGGLPLDLSITMPYDAGYHWAGQRNVGQSLRAAQELGREKGYSLVYAEPPNAFFVLTSILPPHYREVSARKASRDHWPAALWRRRRWKRELSRLAWTFV